MKKSKYIIMTITCILILYGCWSAGEKRIMQEETLSKLEIGKSTKEDVKAILGDPFDVNFLSNGEEQWKYMYIEGKLKGTAFIPVAGLLMGSTESETNTLTILFSEIGILKKFGTGKVVSGNGYERIKE